MRKISFVRKDLTEPRLPAGTLSGDDGSELLKRNVETSKKLEWPVHISIDEPPE